MFQYFEMATFLLAPVQALEAPNLCVRHWRTTPLFTGSFMYKFHCFCIRTSDIFACRLTDMKSNECAFGYHAYANNHMDGLKKNNNMG